MFEEFDLTENDVQQLEALTAQMDRNDQENEHLRQQVEAILSDAPMP